MDEATDLVGKVRERLARRAALRDRVRPAAELAAQVDGVLPQGRVTREGLQATGAWPQDARTFGEQAIDAGADAAREVARTAAMIPMGIASGAATALRQNAGAARQILGTDAVQGVEDAAAEAQDFLSRWSDPMGEALKSGAPEGYDPQATDPTSIASRTASAVSQGVLGVGAAMTGPIGLTLMTAGYYGSTLTATDQRIRQAAEVNNRARVAAGQAPVSLDELNTALTSAGDAFIEASIEAVSNSFQASAATRFSKLHQSMRKAFGRLGPFLGGTTAEGIEEVATQAAQTAWEYATNPELRAQHRQRAVAALDADGVNLAAMDPQERERTIASRVFWQTAGDSLEAGAWGAVGGAAGHGFGVVADKLARDAFTRRDEAVAGRMLNAVAARHGTEAAGKSDTPTPPKQAPYQAVPADKIREAADAIRRGERAGAFVNGKDVEGLNDGTLAGLDSVRDPTTGLHILYDPAKVDPQSMSDLVGLTSPAAGERAFIKVSGPDGAAAGFRIVRGEDAEKLQIAVADALETIRADGLTAELVPSDQWEGVRDGILSGMGQERPAEPAQAPASGDAAEPSIEDRIAAALDYTAQTKTPGDTLVRVPEEAMTPDQRKQVEAGKRIGRPVVFFTGTKKANGFYSPMAPNVVFLNADERIAQGVEGMYQDFRFLIHEDAHAMRHGRPDVFSLVSRLIDPRDILRRAMPEIRARMAQEEGSKGRLPPKKADESWSEYVHRVSQTPDGAAVLSIIQEEGVAGAMEKAAAVVGQPAWASTARGLRALIQRANRALVRAGLRGRLAQTILWRLEQRLHDEATASQAKPAAEGQKAKKPRAGQFELGHVVRDGTIAVMDADGRVWYDEAARMHGDLLESFPEIEWGTIIDGGQIIDGKYRPFLSDGGYSGLEGEPEQARDVRRFTAIVNGEEEEGAQGAPAEGAQGALSDDDLNVIAEAIARVKSAVHAQDEAMEAEAAAQEDAEAAPGGEQQQAATDSTEQQPPPEETEPPAAPAPEAPPAVVRAKSQARMEMLRAFLELAAKPGATPKQVRADVMEWIRKAMGDAPNESARLALVDAGLVMRNNKTGFMAAVLRRRRSAEARREAAAANPAPPADPVAIALAQALAAAPPDTDRAAFEAGFRHATDGKTRSTLAAESQPSRLAGYVAARTWLDSDEGAAHRKGATDRLENTGVTLRRWWEQKMKAARDLTEPEAFVEAILAANARSTLFPADHENAMVAAYLAAVRTRFSSPLDYLIRRNKVSDRHELILDVRVGDETGDEKRRTIIDMATEYRAVLETMRSAVAVADTVQDAVAAMQNAAAAMDPKKLDATTERSYIDQNALLFGGSDAIQKLYQRDSTSRRIQSLIDAEKSGHALEEGPRAVTRERLDHITREGWKAGRPQDRNVTPQELKEDFGLADVGFGKWVGSERDQDHLNYIYDAFTDLAETLGIPPKAIGLDGTLHVTIGALGHGRHAAHYAPNQPAPDGRRVAVINVTNTRGDGTVAHEWAHALDFHLRSSRSDSRQHPAVAAIVGALSTRPGIRSEEQAKNLVQPFATGSSYYPSMRSKPPVEHALLALRYYNKASHSTYKRDALALDGVKNDSKNAYWSNKEELFARAFEAYVYDKFTAEGKRSDYLVHSHVGEGVVAPPRYRGRPYPVADERATLAPMFDSLVRGIDWTPADGKTVVTPEGTKTIGEVTKAPRTNEADFLAWLEKVPEWVKEFQNAKRGQDEWAAAEARRKATEAAELDQATGGPKAPTPDGKLSRDDLNKLFEEAIAEEVEANQEKSEGEGPGTPALKDPAPPAAAGKKKEPGTKRGTDGATPPSAAALIAEAAKLGVSGLDEAAKGLAAIFGAGRLQSFPSGFDAEAYNKAVPHFRAALRSFQQAGRTIKELFRLLVRLYGPGIQPYAVRFAEEEGLANDLSQHGASDAPTPATPGSGANDPGGTEGQSPGTTAEAGGQDQGEGVRPDGGRLDGSEAGAVDGSDHSASPSGAGSGGGSATGGRAGGRGGQRNDADASGGERRNYLASPGSLARTGSWFETAARNVTIIELVKSLAAEGRPATPEEQATIARYAGWGASELANKMFPVGVGRGAKYAPERLEGRWRPLGERLQATTTPQELNKIMQSTQYAHYTSETVTRAVWDAMIRMGFTGGTVLEPGMGIGAFPLTAPASLAGTIDYTGIERDPLTASIAKQLLQASAVRTADFVEIELPRDHYDAAIGNPPFSSMKVLGDPDYRSKRFMLHDFFFAKTLDRIRPGGILAFITSSGTMDKGDEDARRYLAERADLIGAIRLPRTAFDQHAGTEVVTDIVFLRRRGPDEPPSGPAWIGRAQVQTPQGPALVNEYFASHPEMVLGTHAKTGTMYAGDSYTVEPNGDLATQLAAAVQRLPANVMGARKAPAARVELAKEDDRSLRVFEEGGVLKQVTRGQVMTLEKATGIKWHKREKAFIRDAIGLRDLVTAALDAQRADDPKWEGAQKAMVKGYRGFVKKHGRILDYREYERKDEDEDGNPVTVTARRLVNKRVLTRSDPRFALFYSLERVTDDGIEDGDVLTKRVLQPPQRAKVVTASDALAESLADLGRLDVADVARRIGMDTTQVLHALGNAVFEDPFGGHVLAEDYLSGDVVTALERAREAAAQNPRFRRNVEALEAVQPPPVAVADIDIRLGAKWLPASLLTKYATERLEQPWAVVKFDKGADAWKFEGRGVTVPGHFADRPAAGLNPWDVMQYAMDGTRPSITKMENGKRVRDEGATAAASQAIDAVYEDFQQWVRGLPAGAIDKLAATYNQLRNRMRAPVPDGSHLAPPGLALKYKRLYDYQKNAIWRIIRRGSTYLAHAVGAGKTLTMIVSAMEQRRLGLIRKPLFAVPISVLQQFGSEFMEAYPGANILVLDDEDMTAAKRGEFLGRLAATDYDAIIMSHSAFSRIKVGRDAVERVLAPIREAMTMAMAAATDKRLRKRIEKRLETLEQWFAASYTKKPGADDVLTFEQLGVDFLYVDEAHVHRKLQFTTSREQGQMKGITPDGSKIALDLAIKLGVLRDRNPKRSHVLASGTPITNTLAELFTLQRYMQPDLLSAMGLADFDSWAMEFGRDVALTEADGAGRLISVTRFSKFANMPELGLMVRQVADVVTSEMLDRYLKRPRMIGGGPQMVEVKETTLQEALRRTWIQPRLEASKKWKPSRDEPHNPDPIMAINNVARTIALDHRYGGPAQVARMPAADRTELTKLEVAIDKVLDNYHRDADAEYEGSSVKGATQIVFTVLGFGDTIMETSGFDAREYVMKRLLAGGVKRDHVAWMWDLDSADQRKALNRAMNDGEVRILFASPAKGGTGLNVQRRLKSLHYLSPPWYPADVEQPMGRIIRQGNLNEEVDVYWYLTQGTYEQAGWTMVSNKARSIQQFLRGDASVRSIDELAEMSPYEQAAAAAAGDPRFVRLLELEKAVAALETAARSHYDDAVTNARKAERARAEEASYRAAAARAHDAAARLGTLPIAREALDFRVGGEAVPGETAGEQISHMLGRLAGIDADSGLLAGTAAGGAVELVYQTTAHTSDLFVVVPLGPDNSYRVRVVSAETHLAATPLHSAEATGLATRIHNAINAVPSEAARLEELAATNLHNAKKYEAAAAVAWPKQAELDKARAQRDALKQELGATQPANPSPPPPDLDLSGDTRLSRPEDPEAARRAIEAATGVSDTSRATTEREALRGSLARQEKVADTAYRKGEKAGASAEAVRLQVKRAMQELRDRMAKKQEAIDDLRERLASTLREVATKEIAGNYIAAMASVSTPGGLLEALERLEMDMARAEFRSQAAATRRLAKKRLGRAVRRQLPKEFREIIERELAAAHVAAGKSPEGKGRSSTFTNPDDYVAAAERIRQHHDTALEALAQARLLKRGMRMLRGMTVAQAARSIVGNVSRGGRARKRPHGLTNADPDSSLMDRLVDLTSDARSLTAKVEGGVRGMLYHLLVRRMRAAESAKYLDDRRFMMALEGLLRAAGFKGLTDATTRLSGWMGRASQQTVTVTLGGQPRIITMDQALGLVAMDDDTIAHLSTGAYDIATRLPAAMGSPIQMEGGRQTRPIFASQLEVRALRTQLPSELVALVDAAKDLREQTTMERLFRVHRSLKGYEPVQIKRQWPRLRNRDQVDEMALDANASKIITKALENSGILQERTGGTLPLVVRGFLETLIDTVDRELHIIHFAEPLRVGDAVLHHPAVVQAIAARWGDKTNNDLRALLYNAAGVTTQQAEPVMGFARGVQANLIRAWLTLNPRTYLRQFGGLGKVAPYIRPDDLAAGIAAAVAGIGRHHSYSRLHELSGYFWKRHTANAFARLTQNRDDRLRSVDVAAAGAAIAGTFRSAASLDLADAARNVSRIWDSIQFLNAIDRFMAVATWEAFRSEGRREHPHLGPDSLDAWAARKAERVFRDTQNVSSPADDTVLQSKNKAIVSLWLPLTSDPAKSFNMLTDAVRRRKPGETAAVLAGLAGNIVVSALVGGGLAAGINELVVRAFASDDDDDRRSRRWGDFLAKVMESAARDIVATILPYGGDALYAALRSAFTGKPDITSGSMIAEASRSVLDLVAHVHRTIEADPRSKETVREAVLTYTESALETASLLTGQPFTPLFRLGVKGPLKALDDYGPKGALRFWRRERDRLLRDEAQAIADGRPPSKANQDQLAKAEAKIRQLQGDGEDDPAEELQRRWERVQRELLRLERTGR